MLVFSCCLRIRFLLTYICLSNCLWLSWFSNIWCGPCVFINRSGPCSYICICMFVSMYILFSSFPLFHSSLCLTLISFFISLYFCLFLSASSLSLLHPFLLSFIHTSCLPLCDWLESYTQQCFDSSSEYIHFYTYTQIGISNVESVMGGHLSGMSPCCYF